MNVRSFTHRVGEIDWYCEQQGAGPHVILVPSGEGDCASFAATAAHLASDFTVLTFDMPGFSRTSKPRDAEDILISKLADQIAGLVSSLGAGRATFYGCSSGGVAVLDLLLRHPELVTNALVHEVPFPGRKMPLNNLVALDDEGIIKACRDLFENVMNEDPNAWRALGPETHARLDKNYITWVRRYVDPARSRPSFNPSDFAGSSLDWTIGGLTPVAPFFSNVQFCAKAGIEIGMLMCRHFPQVSIPLALAEHIKQKTLRYLTGKN
ncbi:MAG: alpha/beta fold hydrolase [Xanthobacteraceae bacterium]